jgi:probable O-glycosylation ligase (exosortase A-associated)
MSANLKPQWWRANDAQSRLSWWRPAPVEGTGPVSTAAAATMAGESAVPFWALFAFIFILFLSPQSWFPALAPLRIALATMVIALTSLVVTRFVNQRQVFQLSRESWIAFLLLAWAVVTIPFSYWPGGSVSVVVGQYAKSLFVFLLLSQVVNTLPRLRIIAWGLSLMAAPIALVGIRNYLTGNFLEGLGPSDLRIQGYDAPLTGNPNDLALTLNLILPLTIALFTTCHRRGLRALLLGLMVLDVTAIIATFSRGGFIAFSVMLAIYLFILCRRGGAGWAFLIVVLILSALPFLPSSYIHRIATITSVESDTTGSSQERWTYMAAATQYTLTHPLVGAGIGMNMLALNEMRGPAWKEVHNVYLEYAMELGFPGVVLFLLLLRGCLASAREVQRQTSEQSARRELSALAEGVRISLIVFAVAALFHPVAYHFYFYFFAGLALALKTISGETDGATSPSPQPTKINA